MNLNQKKNFLSNIDYLLKSKGMKKTTLEKNAGVSPGYLSRFNNDDPNNLPSISFVESAAKQLNVNMELLFDIRFRPTNSFSSYQYNLLSKLIKDTEDEKITWDIFSQDSLERKIKNGNENLPFLMTSISYELKPDPDDYRDEDGVLENYPDQEDDCSSTEVGFEPAINSSEFENDGEQSDGFIQSGYSICTLNSGVKVLFMKISHYRQHVAYLETIDWNTLWVVGDEINLIASESFDPELSSSLSALEDAIANSQIPISISNRNAIEKYLEN